MQPHTERHNNLSPDSKYHAQESDMVGVQASGIVYGEHVAHSVVMWVCA